MAVVVGQYILAGKDKTVKLSNTNISDYAIGLTLPLQMGTQTFNQSYDNLEQLKSNVKNLLLTNRGERLAQPLFGTNLRELLFEQNTDDIKSQIYESIENAIEFWLPQLEISSIDIESNNSLKDSNTINVSIVFTAKYNQQNFKVDFAVNS
jgi:phage baseplate assembly protein W